MKLGCLQSRASKTASFQDVFGTWAHSCSQCTVWSAAGHTVHLLGSRVRVLCYCGGESWILMAIYLAISASSSVFPHSVLALRASGFPFETCSVSFLLWKRRLQNFTSPPPHCPNTHSPCSFCFFQIWLYSNCCLIDIQRVLSSLGKYRIS